MAIATPILSALGLVGSLIGTGLEVAGNLQEAEAYATYAEYQASIADKNERVQRENARRTIDQAQVQQVDQDAQAAALQGEQLATQGASGLSTTGRSQVLTRGSAKRLAAIDRRRIRDAGNLEAKNFLVASKDARGAAKYARQEAKNARTSGWIGAGASLAGGAGRLANYWAYQSPQPQISSGGGGW